MEKHSVPAWLAPVHLDMWKELIARNPDADVDELREWAADITWNMQMVDTLVFLERIGAKKPMIKW